MKNWQKDAQPEWPEAASGTRKLPKTEAGASAESEISWFGRGAADGDDGDARGGSADATDVLPPVRAPESDATDVLPAVGGPADPTDVLPPVRAPESDATDVLPTVGGPADPTAVLPSVPAPADATAVLPAPADSGGTADKPRKGSVPAADAPGDVPPSTTPAPAPAPASPSGTGVTDGRSAAPTATTSGWPKLPRPAAVTAAVPAPTAVTDVLPSAPARVRDPWPEGDGTLGRAATAPGTGRGAAGPAGGALAAAEPEQHDPHEVTVQLDAVQFGDGVLRRAAGGPVSADAADRPVFVDESGRRSRLYRRIGIAVGLACAVYAVVMVVTLLSGTSDAPWLPVPGQEDGKPAGKVDTTPLPTGSVDPSVTGSPSPQTTPSATGAEERLPTADASASDTAPATGQTETETDPGPTVTDTASAQDGDETEPDPTDTATEPAAGSPDPTPTDTGATTPDPTETTGDDGTDTDIGSGALAQAPGTSSPRSPFVEYTN